MPAMPAPMIATSSPCRSAGSDAEPARVLRSSRRKGKGKSGPKTRDRPGIVRRARVIGRVGSRHAYHLNGTMLGSEAPADKESAR